MGEKKKQPEERKLFAVFKLQTKVLVKAVNGKDDLLVKIGGAAGYIPVYSTIDEAEEAAFNGKYQIFAVSVSEKEML